MEETPKEKLQKKLRQKSSRRNGNKSPPPPSEQPDDILKMMEQVSQLLKSNPELVKQVSKCVNTVMGDKNLMENLTGKIQDQVLVNSDEDEDDDASSKELVQ